MFFNSACKNIEINDPLWHNQRFLSVGFYALVYFSKVNLALDYISDICE